MRTFDHGAIINTAFLHPNQVEVFIGDQNGLIRIWDLAANNTRDLLDDKESIGIRSLTISSDGSKLVAANSVGICFVWTSVNSEASQRMLFRPAGVYSAAGAGGPPRGVHSEVSHQPMRAGKSPKMGSVNP